MDNKTQLLADVFTTALEGGINPWFGCDTYKWKDLGDKFYATGREWEGDGTVLRIDLEVIDKGLKAMLASGESFDEYISKALLDISKGNLDEADYDAEVADCIVQYGLFGEQVYA